MTSSLSTPRPADRSAGVHASGPREQALLRRCSPPAPGPGRNPGRARIGSTGCLLLAVMAAAPAVAGGPSSPGRAAPWQAEAPVPAVRHESAFSTYRPHVDTPVGDWRAANEAVNRIGGWRAYGREAGAPLQPLPPVAPTRPGAGATPPGTDRSPVAPAQPSAAPPARGGHDGHGAHSPAPAAGGSR
jgi:hypothetical protein